MTVVLRNCPYVNIHIHQSNGPKKKKIIVIIDLPRTCNKLKLDVLKLRKVMSWKHLLFKNLTTLRAHLIKFSLITSTKYGYTNEATNNGKVDFRQGEQQSFHNSSLLISTRYVNMKLEFFHRCQQHHVDRTIKRAWSCGFFLMA